MCCMFASTQDTWVAPNWLLFGPDKAADGALAFRRDEAPIAAQCAKEFNYTGLDYPWDIAFGATPASTGPRMSKREH